MVLPRILNDFMNGSSIDLENDYIREIPCIANGYPKPFVVWTRGFSKTIFLFCVKFQ